MEVTTVVRGKTNTDLLNKVIDLHWTKGGTGISNFHKEECPLFEKAIELYGNPRLLIVDRPFPGENDYMDRNMMETLYSLHYVGCFDNLSAFWKILQNISQGSSAAEDGEISTVRPADIASLIRSKRQQMERLQNEINVLAEQHIPDFNALDHQVSTFWSCNESPIGMCVFTLDDMGRPEGCRYCGQPPERR